MNALKMLALAAVVAAAASFAATAEAGNCCPPPPPVKVNLCVVHPCTGCTTNLCVCVPCCCKDQTPCLASCTKGLLGRKILTYKYPCGHCVTVVAKRNGSVKAR